MNSYIVLAILTFVCSTVLAAQPAQPPAELTARGALPNFFTKALTRQPLRIAYIGGSITAADGWRPQTTKWISQQFPDAAITETNAAIGGTGSDLGVFRFARDVLQHNPDLIFIEFAVNDAGAPPDQIHRCIEGIVRQAWKHNPSIDLCFVYTLVDNMVPTLAKGQLNRSAAAIEQVADHYAIPSIHMGLEVVRLATAGQLIMKTEGLTPEQMAALKDKLIFSADGVHPRNNTGHRLYTEAVARSFQKMKPLGSAGPHKLPAPFTPDNYEAAKLVPLSQAKLSPGFRKLAATDRLAKSFARFLPDLYVADKPGLSLSFKFKGAYAGFYDLLGPDCGQLLATVDAKPVTIPRFDPFCTYHRMGSFVAARGLPDAVHTVTVQLDANAPDKPAILAKRNETIDDPQRYAANNWYVGYIMIIGDMLD